MPAPTATPLDAPSRVPSSLRPSGLDRAIHWPFKSLRLALALRDRGIPADQALADTGWRFETLSEPGLRVSPRQHLQLCENALRHAPDPLFAMRLGWQTQLTELGPYGALLRACPDGQTALRYGLQYRALTMPLVEVQARVEGAFIVLRFSNPLGLHAALFRFLTDFQIGLQVQLQASFAGQACPPADCSRSEPEPDADCVARMERLLGCPIRWAQPESLLRLPLSLLQLRNPQGDALALAGLEQSFQGPLLAATLSPSWREQVQALLNEASLPWPKAAGLAAQLGVPERSLRRHLAREGSSFQALSDAARMARAAQWLRQPAHSVEQVAGALGYTDPSGFRQAFKRQFGLSPSAFRRQG